MNDLEEIARVLDDAANTATAVAQISVSVGNISLSEAYDVQRRSIELRIERGEKISGVKMGFTSRAKAQQMGVDDLIWGRLTDAMRIDDGVVVLADRFVHPRAEPEVAFLLGTAISPDDPPEAVFSAVEAVAPAIEIIDSRYKDFKFNLTDVVADNASSSGYVCGAWQNPEMDLSNLGMLFRIDSKLAAVGSSAAILGAPLRSLQGAARLAAGAGLVLEEGFVVLAGAATVAVALQAGQHIECEVQNLGRVEFTYDTV